MATGRDIAVATQIIHDHVLRPYENEFHHEAWRGLPEIPDKSEIMPKEVVGERQDFFVESAEPWNDYQSEVPYSTTLPHNIVKGPWPSKEEYIAAHYQILREDAVANLRSSVEFFKGNPNMMDDRFTHIYTDIHFKGLLLGQLGAAFRIEFSHERAGKQIRWEQSKRLQQGTMVALSPMRDMFRTICKVAIVAARPIERGLDQNPPQIDIFWGDYKDAVFDPVEPYVMLESQQGYFEASRHMLVALQKLRTETFQLSKHLADLDNDIGAPDWLEEQRLLDLTSLIHPESDIDSATSKPRQVSSQEEVALWNADVLQGFPHIPSSGMDESQMSACERMVTKKVSIVQGPPGTGKTFTSIAALRVLIENLSVDSPPIIIAAQTNHALDQLLNHVLAFEPNVLRLGGRSDKENVEIQKRTLYTLRMTAKGFKDGLKGMKTAFGALDNRIEEIKMSLAPLLTEDILSDETLLREGIISEAQKDSLNEEGWANGGQSGDGGGGIPPLIAWLGPDQLVPIPKAPIINLGLPVEESDLEFEQLQRVELEDEESPADKENEALRGQFISFHRQWTGRSPPGVDERQVRKLLSWNKNLYDIPMGMRGPIYRYWEKKLNKNMLEKLHLNLKEYKATADSTRIVKWVNNYKLIRHLGVKVIGCTTTGLSKYRGLLAALQPRTLLIEEAAETLEGTVMAGMFESLEQLILVGDHQQLQAHASIRALEQQPYHLNMSMFERLVNNSISYTMLNTQRRMIPDVRKLLCIEPKPFYSNLLDHPSVLDRKTNRVPIPGMGGKDTYFFSHNWPEGKNPDQSRYNADEAEMIAGFYNHLVLNDVEFSKITVLTFYNGQRKAILKELKRHPSLGGNTYYNVFTVDSYQGEENDVIILSLVRSNELMGIGFLENKNRLVVALSRARRGLFVFGNPETLTCSETQDEGEILAREPLWSPLIDYLKSHGRLDLEGGLPITCQNHKRTIHVVDASQWIGLAGGCTQKCMVKLSCGHLCPHPCHPFDHERVICGNACKRILSCGHGCSKNCGENCYCADPACIALAQVSLENDQAQYEMPVLGGAILGSPTKKSQTGISDSRRNGTKFSVSPQKDKSSSQDIRRESSNSTFKSFTSVGKVDAGPDNGLKGGQRNTSSRSVRTPSRQSDMKMWSTWNAQKADKEANEENLRLGAANKLDQSTLVYKETYRAIKVEDGVRMYDPVSSTKRVVPRTDAPALAPLNPQPTSPNQRVLFESTTMASMQLRTGLQEYDPPALPPGASQPISSNNVARSTFQAPPKFADPSSAIVYPKFTTSTKTATPNSGTLSTTAPSATKGAARQPEASAESVASKSAATFHDNLRLPANHFAAHQSTVPTSLGAPSNTMTSEHSRSSIGGEHILADVALGNVMMGQDRMSSALTDLLGLEIGTPASDPFGNADDFDQFEKHFM